MKFYLECIIEYMNDTACWFFYVQKIKATWKECLEFASKPQIKVASYVSAE